ncbi:MAG: XRE family transcriptional regulator [Mesorhizobium sp.]|jgi:transcriptional regulator with XRE-family HTH domain|uniref:helix-turn-helix domain-containing protein n=1 Tax=Mesorhizobium sp. TaxID=1871066 RepID=UPI000FE985BB|nr:helix-turn-helix transcriptional regulator [Mesorhizobium sp.]RWM18448.1 MAG: XRE family transcriptional regulator [Mesorhizobium sp.]
MEHVLELSVRIKKQWRCLVAPLTPEQVTAARALLNWPRVRLGAKCDLSEASIREFERGRRMPSAEKLLAMRQVLQAAGVAFFGQDGSGKPVVRLHASKAPHVTNLAEGEGGIIGNSEM